MLGHNKLDRQDDENGVNEGAVIEIKDHRRSVKLKYLSFLVISIAFM